MGNKREQSPIAVCKRCNNSWWKRTPEPKKCPACQSRNWKNGKTKKSVVIIDKSVEFINGKKRFTLVGEEKRD